jgi:hypothetical protein
MHNSSPIARMLTRMAVLVFLMSFMHFDQVWGWIGIALDLLLIDLLVMQAVWARCDGCGLDEHCPAVAVAVSFGVSQFRASIQDEGKYATSVFVAQLIWCCVCLVACTQAKQEAGRSAWVYGAVNLEFYLLMLISEGPQEAFEVFYWRAVLFAMLSCFLYSYVPNHPCMIGQRGYLLCYLPVLVVSFGMALAFSVLSLVATAYGDTCACQQWPRPVLVYYEEEVPDHEVI